MDLRQCYDTFGGNYDETLKRMMNSEAMLKKFLLKFLSEGSFELLKNSLDAGDGATAFRASHTLKGVCQNLGIDKLAAVSAELTELLRNGTIPAEAASIMERVTAAYHETIDAIEVYQQTNM